MKTAQWETQRSGLLMFFGACFLLPGLMMLVLSVVPSLLDAQQGQTLSIHPTSGFGDFLARAVLAIVFSLIGGGIVLLGWKGRRINTAADLDNEPWSISAAWQGQPITSDARLGVMAMVVFTVVWNLITALVIGVAGPQLLQERDPFGLLLIVFVVAGALMIFRSMKISAEWRHFGKTPLTLDPFPGQLGGVVKGYVSVSHLLPVDSDINVTVVAMRRRRGRNRSSDTPLWQRARKATVEVRAEGCRLRFDIPIEKDLPPSDTELSPSETDDSGMHTRHFWRLRLEHAGSGLDRAFDIPVFDVSPDKLVQSQSRESEYAPSNGANSSVSRHWFGLPDVQQPAPVDALPPGVLPSDKTLQMHFPLSHGMGTNLVVLLIGLAFLGGGVLAGSQMGGFFGWAFGSIFLFVGGIMALAGLCEIATTKTVVFDTRTVQVATGFMGTTVRKHQLDYGQIQSFQSQRSGSSSTSGGQHKIYYKVSAILKEGKDVKIASMVEGDEAADGLVHYLDGLIAA